MAKTVTRDAEQEKRWIALSEKKEPVTRDAAEYREWDLRCRRDPAEYLAAIRSCFAETNVLLMAMHCRNACINLGAADLAAMKASLPFEIRMFEKYVKIGKKSCFYHPDIRTHLPRGFFLLDELARLDDAVLKAAVDDGTVSPALRRPAFDAWKRRLRGEKPVETKKAKPRLIDLYIAASDDERAEVEALIDKRRAGATGPVIAEEVLAAVH